MPKRYEEATPAARQLLTEYDEIDLAEMLATAQTDRDGAYRERAHLVAWLAAKYEAVIAPAPDVDEPGWQILYLYAGCGQMSWHISPRDADLFKRVEHVPVDHPRAQWDGHTTPQKHTRIRSHTRVLHINEQLKPPFPAPPDTLPPYAEVSQYRTDHGGMAWAWRCWGDGPCDGGLGLDHDTERWARNNLNNHLADHHPKEPTVTQPTQTETTCTATITGPHVPGGGPVQCTREAGHPSNHVGPKQGNDGKTLWTDHHAGATPHEADSEKH